MTATLARTVLALSVVVATTAFAADKPKKEGAIGKGGGAMLTKEQLRNCIALKASTTRQDDELAKEQAGLIATQEQLGRDGDELRAKLETLDRTNAEAVAAYNGQAQARDKQVDDFQARVNTFNTRVEAGKTDHDSYTRSCGNRRFFEDDEIAIKKGK